MSAKIREYGSDALATEARRSQVRQWAEAGHVDAQLGLERAYSSGTHVGKDTREAIRWYQAAAEQGNAAAQSRLAHLFTGYDDTAVRNVPMALEWQRELSRCHSAASKRIVERYTYVPANGCDLVESGTFYCDPNNSRNVDFDRNVVIRDACSGEFDP